MEMQGGSIRRNVYYRPSYQCRSVRVEAVAAGQGGTEQP
jgi:hypothetical protein